MAGVTARKASSDEANLIHYAIAFLLFASCIPILAKVPRTRGKNITSHVVFGVLSIASVTVVPESMQDVVFNEVGVLILGTLIPVYQSIVAACTFGDADDVAWLQFWIVDATLTYSTEWLDTIAEYSPVVAEHWFELKFLFTAWILLPWTDGGTLFYDKVIEPHVSPTFKKLEVNMHGSIDAIVAVVSGSHLWFLWVVFMSLPEEARRFVVVAMGTVYPIVASTASLATQSTDEVTFWLTYWSCFSILFVAMDWLETFVGSIPGFYSLCLCATVYLFLPLFRGANVIFRRVLVPLSGQYENMLLRDTLLVKQEMQRRLPPHTHKNLMQKAANLFLVEGAEIAKKLK